MGRGERGAEASSGAELRDKGRGSPKPQISLTPADRDRIEARLEALPLDRDCPLDAMRAFGAAFDIDKFRAAHNSPDTAERNRARLVTSNFQAVIDGMVELVRVASTVTGVRPARRGLQANPDIEAVREDGGLTRSQATELIELKDLANALRHTYVTVSADDAHAGVRRVLALLPKFTAAYVKWLARYGITFP